MHFDNYFKTILTLLNFLSNKKINFDDYLNNIEVFKVCKETFKIQLSDIDTFNSYTLKEVLKYNLDYEKIIPYYNYTTVLNFQDPLIKNQIALLDLINYNWLNIFLL